MPAPAPRRRRKEETRGGFRAAARHIACRPRRQPERVWLADTMDWLHLWADSDATSAPDATDEPTRPDSPDDLSADFSPGF